MKVFKGIAEKDKRTMGWYMGFKLHLLRKRSIILSLFPVTSNYILPKMA